MNRRAWIPAFFILGGVLLLQGAFASRPLAGHFGSYQQVMGGMSNNFLRENFSDLLHPKTDLLVGKERGLHLNQYPFPSLLAAGLAFSGWGSVDLWGRLVSISFNLLSILLIGLLAAKLSHPKTGWTAAFLFAFSPYGLVNGQMFFSEPMALTCLLGAFLLLWQERSAGILTALFSGFLFSMAVTGRIHLIVFLPLLWIPFLKQGVIRSIPMIGIVSLAGLALPAAWYGYTYFASLSSEHVLTNLFFQLEARKTADPSYLTQPGFYLKLFETLSPRMLTPLVFPFLFLGFKKWPGVSDQRRIFLAAGLALGSAIIFLSPQKVMAHDFYLIGLFPFICLCAASGLTVFFDKRPKFLKPPFILLAAFLNIALAVPFAAGPLYKIPPDAYSDKKIAAVIKSRTPPEARLVIAGENLATLLYYSARPAWTMEFQSLGKPLPYYLHSSRFTARSDVQIAEEENAMKSAVTWLEYYRNLGASFFVCASKAAADRHTDLMTHLRTRYREISHNDESFYLFDLNEHMNIID